MPGADEGSPANIGPTQGSSPVPPGAGVATAYFLYFSAAGVTVTYLPQYLRTLDLSPGQVGLLAATTPLLALVAPHFWGHLADRTGRADRILGWIAAGAGLAFVPLLWAGTFGTLLAILVGYAAFASGAVTLLDSLALHHVARSGGAYGHLRLWGSIGFIVSATAFGLAADRIDRATVWVPLILWGVLWGWTFLVRVRRARPARLRPGAAWRLLRQRELALLLAVSCLHWIASAPLHLTYSLHVTDLRLAPWVVGVSVGLGVAAEVVVMWLHPVLGDRIAPRRLLLLSCGVGVLRWLGMAVAVSPGALLALALLHGFTFGAFYVAAVTYVARQVPTELRATGQGLFAAVTFGVGGVTGFVLSGVGYEHWGGHGLFAAAAAVDVVAAAIAFLLPRAGGPAEPERIAQEPSDSVPASPARRCSIRARTRGGTCRPGGVSARKGARDSS